jgi:hypothetical protein
MTFHDEVDIEEMDWNDELHVFTYQYVVGASQVGSLEPTKCLTRHPAISPSRKLTLVPIGRIRQVPVR